MESTGYAMQRGACKCLPLNDLQWRAGFVGGKALRNDTRPEDTCVLMTPDQLAIFRAMKLLDELESSSTEIDQPLY